MYKDHSSPMTTAPSTASSLVADRDWWRGAVIYQIYPRSYQDSNGDGIGDLKGITARLPYVAALGVDAIWISPFFMSPMKDFGYDVSDYTNVDPIFGQLADFDALIAEAHRLGIRVMIDLVLSHTSDHMPGSWKAAPPASIPSQTGMSGRIPSGWHAAQQLAVDLRRFRLAVGCHAPAVLHAQLLTSQPDLNLHNVEVQDALLSIERFWLDRGVDGFRLDTINFYFHDRQLRDNPALAPERRNATTAPAVNPYNYQEHLYDKNQPENLAFLRRFAR